jgi:hypothetical protein
MKSGYLIAAATPLVAWATWQVPSAGGTQHYQILVKTSQVVDLSALGQGEQKQNFNLTEFVAVTLADTAGGKTVTMVLDSLKPDSGSPIPAEAAKAAAGVTWRGLLGPNGRVTGLKPTTDNPLASQFGGVLRELLPPVKAGIQAGKSWTDTTEFTDDVPGGSLAVRTITNFTSASETYAGVKAIKIASASSSSVSGTQQVGSGPAAIEGTGTSTGTWYIGPDGAFLGGTRAGTQKLTVSGSFAPEPLPVTVTIEGTSTLLK